MQRIFQYSSLLLILMRSGILFLGIRFIEDVTLRYKTFEIFQLGIPILPEGDSFSEAYSNKINNYNTHPILCYFLKRGFPILSILISLIWSGLFLKLDQVFKKKAIQINLSKLIFWKKVFYLNILFSLFYLIIGLYFDYLNYFGLIIGLSDLTKVLLEFIFTLSFLPFFIVQLFTIGIPSTNGLISYLDTEILFLIYPSFTMIMGAILITTFKHYIKKRKTINNDLIEPEDSYQPKIKWRKIEKDSI